MADLPDAPAARKRSRRWLWIMVLAVALIWIGPWLWFALRVVTGLGLFGSGGPGITISPATTRITKPIGDDGYVDYLRALNERSREGVTPENNAAVLLWQAVGPAEIVSTCDEAACDWYFQQLGVRRPPAEGDYFVTLDDYAQQKQAAAPPDQESGDPEAADQGEDRVDWLAIFREQEGHACTRPWSAEESPELAAWLERNEKPLELVIEASERERFYAPLVPPSQPPPVINALVPGQWLWRRACAALAMRAMLRVEQGKTEEAWQDLLACHRLARLAGQAPTVIESMVAIAMDGIACRGDAAVAQHGNLTAEQARRFRADLENLAPLPNMIDKIDVAERFMLLDSITSMARDGPAAFAGVEGPEDKDSLENRLSQRLAKAGLDWDAMLRECNAFCDRVVETARTVDRSGRVEAVEALNEEADSQFERSRKLGSLAKSFLTKGPGKVVSETMGQVVLALMTSTFPAALQAEDRAVMTFKLTKVALALAAFRADRGSYPESLQQLVPPYLAEVPRDLFADDVLVYQASGQDYLCYSVGPNREDDEGRTYDCEPSGDDLVIRTAPSEKRDD